MKLQNPNLIRTKAYVNGEWIGGSNGELFDVTNPANGELLVKVAKCGASETLQAIASAETAMISWRQKTAKERASLLHNWYDLIMQNQEDLAIIMTAEQGKPLAESRAEIAYGANYIEWFAEEAKRIYGDTIPHPANDKRLVCIKQPIGVVACITPWNFPLAMLTRKIAPALAAGCTVVCKPANATPLSALAAAELAHQAGIPAGVINMIAGNTAAIGHELTHSPVVRKLTFTGSTKTGKTLIQQCAGTVKKTSMELGGNAPFIVLDDADLDAAVQGAVLCKFRNAGQTCVCANRILVQENIYEEFVAKFAAAVSQLVLGSGMEQGVSIGPLINEQAIENVKQMVTDALTMGATALTGGKPSDLGGCFYEPTVLTGASDQMRIFREEIFGPVAPVFKFKTEQQAIEMANDTEFGLASYFYARDIGRIWRVAEALEYGIVGINESIVSNEMAPFGGVKESGNGREGSKYGMDDYLEIKYMCFGGLDK